MTGSATPPEVATVTVIKAGFVEQTLNECIAYIVRANGSLEVDRLNGSKESFAVEEWIDVRMEPENQSSDR
jgi:hypothetical protein